VLLVRVAGIDTTNMNVLVSVPSFLTSLSTLVGSTPVAALQAYMKYSLLHGVVAGLPAAFRDENFNFYSRILSGVTVRQPRNLTCADATNNALSDILGRYFVDRAFPGLSRWSRLSCAMTGNCNASVLVYGTGESKDQIKMFIGLIKDAFGVRLKNVEWFDEPTRTAAQGKLAKVLVEHIAVFSTQVFMNFLAGHGSCGVPGRVDGLQCFDYPTDYLVFEHAASHEVRSREGAGQAETEN